jgi:hypothetical protein
MVSLVYLIVLIILASAVYTYLDGRGKGTVPCDAEQRLMGRMYRLECRLTDIQDLMISIDERLSRSPVRAP